jgi:glutaredoxin
MTVVMYVKPGAPTARPGASTWPPKGVEVQERDATENADWKAELMGYTNGRGNVPTIIRDGERPQVGFPPWLRRQRRPSDAQRRSLVPPRVPAA